MKQMKTLTMPNGVTYEIVDDKARKDLASLESETRRDCMAPITQVVSGSTIAVDDSSNRPVRNLRLFGKTTQVVTTGAQLISQPYFDSSKTTNGIVWFTNSDGSVSGNGTATANSAFYLTDSKFTLSAGTYTISGGRESTIVRVDASDISTGSWVKEIAASKNGSPVTFTLSASDVSAYTFTVYIMVENGNSFNGRVYPMLNSGSTAISYEPYTGCIAGPNPDYPQELNSVENATVTVLGKNLLPYPYSFGSEVGAVESENGATFMNIGDGGIAFYGTPTDYAAVTLISNFKLIHDISVGLIGTYTNVTLEVNVYSKDGKSLGGISNANGITIRKSDYPDGSGLQIAIKRRANGATMTGIGYPIAVAGTEMPTEYEKYVNPKSVSINHTLSGIPVDSGGNYTNTNGQQWICDEIDFERGVYIQRIGVTDFTDAVWSVNSNNQFFTTLDSDKYVAGSSVMCSHLVGGTDIYINAVNAIRVNATIGDGSAEALGNALSGATLLGILSTPIITPLTEDELAAHSQLCSNYPVTTVINDKYAWMEMEYSVDLEKFIMNNNSAPSDEQVSQAVASYLEKNPPNVGGSPARIGNVSLLASKWVGSNHLYSQVVTIEGVTENSQVDLTPSVEQLVVFYEKDLTFVTEQEGGVVTVYAIGQKPEHDYTIQVTITEVNV